MSPDPETISDSGQDGRGDGVHFEFLRLEWTTPTADVVRIRGKAMAIERTEWYDSEIGQAS